jgi:DNA-directed RNA polymerase specialized sigma24 family protein
MNKDLRAAPTGDEGVPATAAAVPPVPVESFVLSRLPLITDPNQCLIPGVERRYVQAAIYKVLHDLEEMRDVESEVVLYWHEHRLHVLWPPIRYRRAYVVTMARRAALARLKRRAREGRVLADLQLMTELLQEHAPCGDVELSNLDLLRHVLNGLPEPCLTALLLHKLCGYEAREIAQQMNIKVGQVNYNLAKAAALMADRIEEYKTQRALTERSPSEPGQE